MERKIDEIFQDDKVTLKVVENKTCEGCYYDKRGHCYCDITKCGSCGNSRTDKNQ